MTHPDKESLRQVIQSQLKAQSSEEREKRSLSVEKKLFNLDVFKKAVFVCFYVSTPWEVDTASMIDKTLKAGKRVLVPLSNLENKELELYEITNCREDLKKGTFGIMEPLPERTRRAGPETLDCVVVPGIVFDREKNRIGRGKGFYDRFLSQLPSRVSKIGLSFSFQVVSSIPIESHDVKLDFLLTD